MAKTHWRKILESDYLAGSDLDDGTGKFQEIAVTITKVSRESVKDQNGKNEDCLVLKFKEKPKPMICNVTNAKVIEKLAGSQYIEDWVGLRILLGTQKIKAFGETWDALRIRPRKLQAEQPAPAPTPCADCSQTIVAGGGVSAQAIIDGTRKTFNVPLCLACAQARKKASDPVPSEPTEPEVTDADS